ncbi:hypothetical protein FHW96_001655 [Novosphingobium sp. SG751A]|uniref:hypothetical protein n=1 Tax=Novosphingobium sp. SG751A TaxID=2587000 RepID=UPI0015520E87|nr:hypothetical protein [Novosphingobium sp. SG751A]NOW45500.1 hypothetical protein [Novosphingobium sp. SG751A]
MTAGVSPVSPVVHGTPASRTVYEATAVTKADPPSVTDPSQTTPRQPNDGFSGFSTYA